MHPPTLLDTLRYRIQHGTNLGSIFVLEKWLYPSMFEPTAKGDSELDAVTALTRKRRIRSVDAIGEEATRRKWQRHWASGLSDQEIQWLAYEAHITSVRLPVGYFTLGPGFTGGTPFAGAVSEVYINAWNAVLDLCSRLYAVGIGVLLDFHALPGGANSRDHGGTSSGRAELWRNQGNLELAKRCLVFMAEEVKVGRIKGCVGIQLCNEACWGAGEMGMYEWYEDVIKAIGKVDVEGSVPLWISDAWSLERAVGWCAKVNSYSEDMRSVNPVGVAVPKYYCFAEQNRRMRPLEIIQMVGAEMADVQAAWGSVVDKGAVQVLVGEWSCALSEESWDRAKGEEREVLVRRFGRVQSELWRQRAAGSYFWTAKMEWMDGGQWGIFDMVKKGAVVPPETLILAFGEVKESAERARLLRDTKKEKAVRSHVAYWGGVAPGGRFEHWRFEQGWDLGFTDALAFYVMRANVAGAASCGADTIGALELWIIRRLRQSGQSGGFVWEWEHGFRQGASAFEEVMGC